MARGDREKREEPTSKEVSGNFSPEVEQWMKDRARSFVAATQRKGLPMTYGSQKKEPKKR